eukprot:GILJ01026820.1.p1 GENE.GILJ01026820.1~~GILJ01026820.1.p1  ORF type:complete len:177 (+),score=9.51 GILJ01026820.1:74-604(+)
MPKLVKVSSHWPSIRPPLIISCTISEDGTTVTLIADGQVTLRSSQPLSAANSKWSVRILEDADKSDWIRIGLLPKLSSDQLIEMEGKKSGYIASQTLGGWAARGDGKIFGEWQCPPFLFAKGATVKCEVDFSAKTLTLKCGNRSVVGTIPSIKIDEALYPAVSLYRAGQKVAFMET